MSILQKMGLCIFIVGVVAFVELLSNGDLGWIITAIIAAYGAVLFLADIDIEINEGEE